MNKYFCWPPSVNNLFSSERLQQKRPAYHDKMNNVKFHPNVKCVAAVLCACDVIQPKSSLGGPSDHPAPFSPKTAAPVHHDKPHVSRILYTGERRGSCLCFVAGVDAHKGLDIGLTSTQA